MGLSDYRKCNDCRTPMIGIMKESGLSAPRVLCRSCSNEDTDKRKTPKAKA